MKVVVTSEPNHTRNNNEKNNDNHNTVIMIRNTGLQIELCVNGLLRVWIYVMLQYQNTCWIDFNYVIDICRITD